MESSTTTTATPPAAGASKRRRRAALPLGDLTNILPSTPGPRNPSATRPVQPAPSDASACSSTASATPVSKAPPAAAAADGELSLAKSPISTVYTSRRTQGRRDPASVQAPSRTGAAASCPPLGKATRASGQSTKKSPAAQDSRPISSSAPCHPAKKKRYLMTESSSSGRLKLPDDFIKKQRAYFQDIDAFELPEEEASESD